ncbi:LysM peptidoglycan-binding domain-containing protein [Lentilactobacillus sp. IMAU92037]|uniref:LysM peptidoglycan-binding domain-containing protein n=1 Tax=Lentilactobacillus TaxID=2767893 RepID=UPI001C2624A7|nr:LysM peptidoglycan-binding domain-containing protein [Lentilactobacillus sp. TOM.63]MBU9788860.1 LysM peptidoglycan-binding domain-containing protein [Lentilactobacillus dabitei]MBV0929906.1 LysM peptidoglycan-binding domain-containing protein [Lentilactobacillus dabitei]MDM7515750.1 LysM peptidoglycan-binding domain-containing protein [Lentilactobacillus sp. TOM.63]
MVIIIKKSLLTLSVITGFLGLSGVVANADSYTVKSGDTVANIADKFNDTVNGIAKRNNLSDADLIMVGQKLKVSNNDKASKTNMKTSTAIHNEHKDAIVADTASNSNNNSDTSTDATSSATITPAAFQSQGVVYQNGKKWTYYTGAAFADGTTNHGGYDADGYLIVAAPADVPFGTHVQTPLGEGVVHDRGTAIVGNHYDLVMP